MDKIKDLLPFVCEAFGANSKAYKAIDLVYETKTHRFYSLAKNHELYNSQIITEGSLITEEYAKKALGILLNIGDQAVWDQCKEIIKVGWPYTYAYFINNKRIEMSHFIERLARKEKKNLQSPEYNSRILILLFLTTMEAREWVIDRVYEGFMSNLALRRDFYNKIGPRLEVKDLDQETKADISHLEDMISRKVGSIQTYLDLINAPETKEHFDWLTFYFDFEDLSSITMFQDLKITKRDREEILSLFLINHDEVQEEVLIKEFVFGVYTKLLLKAYKASKEYYFSIIREASLGQVKELEKKIEALEQEIKSLEGKLNNYDNTIVSLERETRRLRTELENKESNETELIALREFLFQLETKSEEFDYEEVDYELLRKSRILIVGGHERWQQRFKQEFPNFSFLSLDNLNFDYNLLRGLDFVFFYTDYLSHALYDKAIKETKKFEINIGYLSSNTNIDLVIKHMYKAVKAKLDPAANLR